MKKQLTALSELNHGVEADGLQFDLTLPDYAPAEAIMVDTARLGRLAHLGGLKKVTISNFSGKVTSTKLELNGIDDQNTATASQKVSINKAEAERTLLENDSASPRFTAYHWGTAHIAINQNELEDSILHSKGSVRDPKAWSKKIDKSLRSGIRQTSRHELLNNKSSQVGFLVLSASGVFNGLIIDGFNVPHSFKEVAISNGVGFAWSHIFGQAMNSVSAASKGLPLRNRRASVLYGLQLDRMAAVEVLSRRPHAVRAARPKPAR